MANIILYDNLTVLFDGTRDVLPSMNSEKHHECYTALRNTKICVFDSSLEFLGEYIIKSIIDVLYDRGAKYELDKYHAEGHFKLTSEILFNVVSSVRDNDIAHHADYNGFYRPMMTMPFEKFANSTGITDNIDYTYLFIDPNTCKIRSSAEISMMSQNRASLKHGTWHHLKKMSTKVSYNCCPFIYSDNEISPFKFEFYRATYLNRSGILQGIDTPIIMIYRDEFYGMVFRYGDASCILSIRAINERFKASNTEVTTTSNTAVITNSSPASQVDKKVIEPIQGIVEEDAIQGIVEEDTIQEVTRYTSVGSQTDLTVDSLNNILYIIDTGKTILSLLIELIVLIICIVAKCIILLCKYMCQLVILYK